MNGDIQQVMSEARYRIEHLKEYAMDTTAKAFESLISITEEAHKEIADKDGEIERLRKALRIYADENHYASSIGPMKITPTIMIDKGRIACMALSPKEEVSQDE
ncbi:hypothetical protein [Paenibacillus sp. L3-i20]|uniref:hypothetical protein n=1 Tax=Paenibacillus sp. L3-i20 TaxID=2905833 RepID=UPI001EE11D39|nr:hypothetical protein [Paenibacillus sp. L3-i20]GKU79809.1 hypothetical protein L3i20_v242060 [Paenibacillus sp. L3-i20]